MAKGKTDFLLRDTYEKWLWEEEKVESVDCYCMQDAYDNLLYFDIIASLLYYNERTYAFSVLNRWYEEIKTDKNKKSYWRKYKKFIESIDVHKKIRDNDKKLISSEILKKVRLSFKKTKLVQIDGMDSLINKIGEDEIITLAVESSFFFDKKNCRRSVQYNESYYQ